MLKKAAAKLRWAEGGAQRPALRVTEPTMTDVRSERAEIYFFSSESLRDICRSNYSVAQTTFLTVK